MSADGAKLRTPIARRLSYHRPRSADLTSVGMRCVLERFVRVRCAGSQKIAAERLGISPQHLCDVLNLRREIGPAILRGLGYEAIVVYRRTCYGPLPKEPAP